MWNIMPRTSPLYLYLVSLRTCCISLKVAMRLFLYYSGRFWQRRPLKKYLLTNELVFMFVLPLLKLLFDHFVAAPITSASGIRANIMDDYQPELSKWEYYYLLFLVIVPVKLFCDLWAWMGWELFKNN